MPFTLIKGSFHVQGYSPDGDSIRFQPDNKDIILGLAGSQPKINARNHVQLRIEGIDSLETHYSPPKAGGALHQPLALGHRSLETLLAFTGITYVVWDSNHLTVLSAGDGTRGYILSRTVEKNGRPVAFVFAGEAAEEDGADVHLNSARLRDSYNYLALAKGETYPTYYKGLFSDLRNTLTQAVKEARQKRLGVYEIDRTNDGFSASNLQSITEQYTILPKLFRRLSEYMVFYGTAVGFKNKMEQSKEPVLDLTTSNFTHFDTFIEQADDSEQIRLTRLPEELVFDEMPAKPAAAFSALMGIDEAVPQEGLEVVSLSLETIKRLLL